MTDMLDETASDRAGHRHRLGPFDTETDPSKHDAAITALAGAAWARCGLCRASHAAALAGHTAVLVRLVELVARAYTSRHPLRELSPDGTTQRTADLAEMTATDRATALDRMSREARIQLTDHAASLLVGVWWMRQMAAEAPERAAAAITRARERYDLPSAEAAGAGPAWAWAHLHTARRTYEGASAGSYTTEYTLHLATTDDPGDADVLLGPIALDPPVSSEREADLVLDALGWARAWARGRWQELDPATLQQGNVQWPDGRAWVRSDGHQVLRVRRGAPAPIEPVPYGEDFRWPLQSDRYYPVDDLTLVGPPPGHVRYALGHIASSEPGQLPTSPVRTDPGRAPGLEDERTARARESVERFRQWLGDQVQAHGWPSVGADTEHLSLAVLAWVAGDPDEHRRARQVQCLAAAVAAGHADPAHLETLADMPPLPPTALLQAVYRLYPEA
ncbi:hypothetical protein [Glycomyces sp. MUSA5-2]|uniref:hypothetical protein n=1 Tax=Glycomyces sp. MUSA5-2 TaxID=2053002 RepID=UPI00300A0B64